MEAAVGFTIVAVVTLVALEVVGSRWRLAAKMVASSGFVAVALAAGAMDSSFGRWILVGLALSWLGDLLLGLPRAFLGGLVTFLLAHVAYGVGFVVVGVGAETIVAGLGASVVAWTAWRWLRPHLEDMRTPVGAYVVVITVMLTLAVGASFAAGDGRIGLGAGAFFLSDLAVARERFVSPGVVNRVWGLPTYYAGQLLLALAAG